MTAPLDDPAVESAARTIEREAGGIRPRIAVVLGSGLGAAAAAVPGEVHIHYEDLAGFPVPGVAGHAGRLTLGHAGGNAVAVLEGRAHYYEAGRADAMAVPLRTLRRLGCEVLLMTNAAGSLRREVPPGSLVMITDHINLTGANPLIGHLHDRPADRTVFVDMTDAYDPALRAALMEAAAAERVPLHHGVYACFSGPTFETPAEIRAANAMGADLAGMSLVPETILARHCGLRVAALSAVTNFAAGVGDEPLSHEQTMAKASECADPAKRLIAAFIAAV